jgi:hypothetical protein
MNRGIAKRLMFAGRRDRRQFLAELARAYRRHQLQVELFSLMGSHFHLIVWTEGGTLSEGMRRVQNGFSRWFNRRNRRDGPLVRARFRSVVIRSRAHLFAAMPYVDFNPVKARLCRTPGEYEGGSARHYLADRFPPWLRSERIREMVAFFGDEAETGGETYRRLFGSPPTLAEIELIEGGFRSHGEWTDDLDYLLEAPGARALQWIEEKARNADGLRPACALLAPSLLEVSIQQVKEGLGPLPIRRSRKAWDAWPLMLFGLQNTTAGLSCTALASRHGVSVSTAGRYVRVHRELVTEHPAYAEACRLVTADALEKTYARSRIS